MPEISGKKETPCFKRKSSSQSGSWDSKHMRFDNERNNRNYGQNTCRTEYSTPLRYGNNYRPSTSYGQRSNNQQKKSYSADCSLLKVCYLEIPAAGRLKFFINQWKQITKDKWVLTTAEKGYKL